MGRQRFTPEFKDEAGVPFYRQFLKDPDRFLFVPESQRAARLWEGLVP